MKVRNEYIIFKNGNKHIKFKNTILQKYLDLIIENQFKISNRNDLEMETCFIKFDDPITVTENSQIYSSSFDLCIPFENIETQENNTEISVLYNYNTIPKRFKIFDLNNQNYIYDLEDYIGKKITAIGFGPYYDQETIEIYACVNTNNYNLYLNDKILNITRKDVFSTDGFFHCPTKTVNSPVHLFNRIPSANGNETSYFGVPISVGLGIIPVSMNEEHTVLPYSEHIVRENNILQILDELNVSYYDNGLYPSLDLYPNTNLWPARPIEIPLYPNTDVYPSEQLYPVTTPYLYYMFKYKIYKYQVVSGVVTIVDTDKFYYISVPIRGLKRIKANIEYLRA